MITDKRLIAIHLPQFHPIPENDKWWGRGFTEWTNVTRTKPRFKNHYQPHLPSDLGFYDLRLNEALIAQANLAKEYGIHGFCFYHYWFNGKRLLNRPLDNMLSERRPDFPFMLCWANENWTRRWDGRDQELLIGQEYSDADNAEHIKFLCKNFFKDSRYIKIDGKPVFLIYRTELISNLSNLVRVWRESVTKYGYNGIYLISVESLSSSIDSTAIGFDASMNFQPNWMNLPPRLQPEIKERIFSHILRSNPVRLSNRIFDYRNLVEHALKLPEVSYKRFKSVNPMWDNSARRENNATIFINSTPDAYYEWLSSTLKNFRPYSDSENFVFINAWNEWAEGNHLEPCQRWGRAYLEATRKAALDIS